MTESQKIEMKRSKVRERLAAISRLSGDEYSETIVTEERSLQEEYQGLEVRSRTVMIAEDKDLETAKLEVGEPDAEMRARLELRSRARIGNYVKAALTGKMVNGAEQELSAAAGTDDIPFELWEAAPEHRVTPAPGTVGVNLDPIRPAIFAPSVAEKLMLDMPVVPSGSYATGTIGTSLSADAVVKGGDVPQSDGAITVQTTVPHRIGGSLAMAVEDLAAIGTENFESIFRQNLSMVLSAHLDHNLLNGSTDTDVNELEGFYKRLTDPAAPAANAETWTRFLAIQSGGIDGLWATELGHVAMVVGVETYRLAAATFQGADSEESAASYLKRMGAGFWTNSRMPVKAAHVQQGILCRKGKTGMRTAVAPIWSNGISIDDIYSGARKGERYFTVSTLVGDVMLVQPGAYSQIAFRVSA